MKQCRASARPNVPLQRSGDIVEDPSRLDDEGHEVTLVAVLRRLDVAVHCRCETQGQVRALLEQAPRAKSTRVRTRVPEYTCTYTCTYSSTIKLPQKHLEDMHSRA